VPEGSEASDSGCVLALVEGLLAARLEGVNLSTGAAPPERFFGSKIRPQAGLKTGRAYSETEPLVYSAACRKIRPQMPRFRESRVSATANVDPYEIAKFEALAERWWDPHGEFKPLHELNPLRLEFIRARLPLPGARIIDVGCGGGILSEALAKAGADVIGIDLAETPLRVAELHALESNVAVRYRLESVEDHAAANAGHYDAVTCMELLEHVPRPDLMLGRLAELVRPGGQLFLSTLNRNLKSFLLAIVGAEYVLGLVPRGTHDYERFIRPSELARWARGAGLTLRAFTGISFDPLTRQFRLSRDTGVNYLAHFVRPGAPANPPAGA